jgi:hypothetical protein
MAGQDGRHPDRHPPGRAVGPLHLDLVDLGLGAFQHAFEGRDDPGPVGLGQGVEPAAAVHSLAVHSEDLDAAGVGVAEPESHVGAEDPDGGLLGQHPELLL